MVARLRRPGWSFYGVQEGPSSFFFGGLIHNFNMNLAWQADNSLVHCSWARCFDLCWKVDSDSRNLADGLEYTIMHVYSIHHDIVHRHINI